MATAALFVLAVLHSCSGCRPAAKSALRHRSVRESNPSVERASEVLVNQPEPPSCC